jgi:hypothetical protein
MKEEEIQGLIEKIFRGSKVCTKCGQPKLLSEFCSHPNSPDKLQYWCKPCQNKLRAKTRSTLEGKRKRRDAGLRRWYKISIDEYESLLAKCEYKCQICGGEGDDRTGLHVDHDHQTNKVRGLLCGNCNRALGGVRDNLEIALSLVEYIRSSC